jgi:GNAT superfamily N-acetyltransferase
MTSNRRQKSEGRMQKSEVGCPEGRQRKAASGRRKASTKLLVRPMTVADKPALMRISTRIWQGHDYVPLFFDRWLKAGGFWAGEMRGRLVGYGKATELAPGEMWLEGLRVDPNCRKRGVGKELSRQVLDRTLERRPVSLRLATADVNHESIHIIKAVMGLKSYAEYRFFTGTPLKPRPGPPLVTPTVVEALDFIKRSRELAASKGLLPWTWLFRGLNRRYVSELIRCGYVFGYGTARKLAGLLVLRPHRYRGNDLDISFVAGDRQALAAFRSFLSRVAHDCGTQNISGMAASDEMAAALKSLGLKPHPHISAVLVYDYPI